MNRFEGSSLEEQIKKYTQQLMRQYADASSAAAPSPAAPSPAAPSPAAPSPTMPAPAPKNATLPTPAMPTTSGAPSTPTVPSGITPEQEYRKYVAQNSQRGILRVQTLTARGAYPVPGVKVIISKIFDSGEYVIATQETDNAGKTEGILLPAPDRALSEQPGSSHPYADYKVTVIHPEFATIVALQLPVFAGESSLQMLNMIPLSVSPNGDKNIEYVTSEPSDL